MANERAWSACEKISGPGGRKYKTATGEMVEGQGRFRVRCQSAWGHLLQMTGEKTSVHKPLLSAGDVTDKGHALWLDGNVGYIIQKDSPILIAMRTCFQRVCEQQTFVEWSHCSDERTWSVQSLRPSGWRRWQHWASS